VYQKSTCCWNDAFVRDYVKDGFVSVIRWQLPIAPLKRKPTTYTFRIGYCWVIYGSIVALRQKDLKKLSYSSLAHVGLIAAGAYTLP
jgi:NADH-quinone oxidoreductase subunit M